MTVFSTRFSGSALLFVLTMAFAQASSSAESTEDRARALFAEHRDAVVTVKLVTNQKFSFSGSPSSENESKSESTGTVIDPSGLTIVSLAETDPSSILEAMMAGNPQVQNLKIDSEVRDVKILFSDGTEVDAEVVLRDKDLDIAYLRPRTPLEAEVTHIDIGRAGEPQVLEQVLAINRLGKVAGRIHSASLERIEAIVEKPRRLYIPSAEPNTAALGSPIFTMDGDVVGVLLLRVIQNTDGGGVASMMNRGADSLAAVVVPAADILEGAEQVPPYE